jgi:sortase A
VWLWTERLVWVGGILALCAWVSVALSGAIGSRRELQRFAALQSGATAAPDQSLWSPERVEAWRNTQDTSPPPPLAVLRIPRIGLEVAVLEGTDEWTLNRAVGHIEHTARPGEEGNVAIAGHRDGYFRALQGIAAGDPIELESIGRVDRYRVERIWVVEPSEVSVVDPTGSPALTLVTCYPFYHVGPAPRRFIVRGVREETAPTARQQAPQ